MAITVKEAIYLGNFADADTDEGTFPLENTAPYLQTFGGPGSPLHTAEVDLTFNDVNDSGGIDSDNVVSSDTITGASGATSLDSIVVVSGTVTYNDGSTVAYSNVVMLQTDNGDMYLANSNFAGTDLNVAGKWMQSFQVTSIDGSGYTGLFQNAMQDFACFVAGTRVATPVGERLIEDLEVGDLVTTLDHGAQPIRWIGRSTVLAMGPMAPVRIAKGALGRGVPIANLHVSQQHRMLMRSPIAARMTGHTDVLVAAKAMEPLDRIDIVPAIAPVTYVHLLFDQHEIIIAEGAATESLLPRAQALAMLGPDNTKAALRAMGVSSFETYGGPARMILSGHKRRQAIARHTKNDKPIWQCGLKIISSAQAKSAA